MKNSFKLLLLAVFFICVVSISGVFATWDYPTHTDSVTRWISISLENFVYTPEEVLPNDHHTMIDSVLNRTKGLNASSQWDKAYLEVNFSKYDNLLYSRQNVLDINISVKMSIRFETADTADVDFIIHKISDTEVYVYTMSKSAVDSSAVGDNIVVYRTKLIQVNGIWTATESATGYAQLKTISISRNGLVAASTVPAFDPRLKEWRQGAMPNNLYS